MARRRSTIKGEASYRRLVRALPGAATDELRGLLGRAGPPLAAYMGSLFPVRTGNLRSAIGSRLQPRALSLKIGLLSKADRRAYFYGAILSGGRHAQQVRARRRKPSGGTTTYLLLIRALSPLRVVKRTADKFRADYLPDYHRLSDAMLARAAQGAGDD